jgi:hypothetical protein
LLIRFSSISLGVGVDTKKRVAAYNGPGRRSVDTPFPSRQEPATGAIAACAGAFLTAPGRCRGAASPAPSAP